MFPAGDMTYSMHLVYISRGLEVHKYSITEEQGILPDNQIASLIFLCINSIHTESRRYVSVPFQPDALAAFETVCPS